MTLRRSTLPCGERRQASSTFQVPPMLVEKVETGLRFAMPTMVCAARWKTTSTSYSPSTRSITIAIADVAAYGVDLLDASGANQFTLRNPVAHQANDIRTGFHELRIPSHDPSRPVPPVTRTERSLQKEFIMPLLSSPRPCFPDSGRLHPTKLSKEFSHSPKVRSSTGIRDRCPWRRRSHHGDRP